MEQPKWSGVGFRELFSLVKGGYLFAISQSVSPTVGVIHGPLRPLRSLSSSSFVMERDPPSRRRGLRVGEPSLPNPNQALPDSLPRAQRNM